MKPRMLAALAAVALFLAGCASVQAGKAEPNPDDVHRMLVARKPLTAKDALGDYTTVDFCSLVDPATIARKGGVTDAGAPASSYDYCWFAAKAGGQQVYVRVGNVQKAPPGGQIPDLADEQPRNLTVARSVYGGTAECPFLLEFADGIEVEATGMSSPPEGGSVSQAPHDVLCKLSEAAVDGVASAALAGAAKHVQYPPGSLGRLDPCSVFGAEMIAAQVGQVSPTPALSTHNCRWGPPPQSASAPFAAVAFAVGTPIPPSGATQETLGGHASAVSGNGLRCMVETTLGPAPQAPGQSELVTLFVQAPGKLACDSARALANAAWPTLPTT